MGEDFIKKMPLEAIEALQFFRKEMSWFITSACAFDSSIFGVPEYNDTGPLLSILDQVDRIIEDAH